MKTLSRTLATSLAVLLFLTNSVFAHSIETNFWKERRKETSLNTASGDYQVASLPASLTNLPVAVPSALSSAIPKQIEKQVPTFLQTRYLPLLKTLSGNYGTIRNVAIPNGPSKKIIIHIQDIHRNLEAQQNIGKTVEGLIQDKRIGLIGLEGSFKPVDLAPYRQVQDKRVIPIVADYLLRENRISGSVYAAFVSPHEIPAVVGVDEKTSYNANVEAYKQSVLRFEKTKNEIEKIEQGLIKHQLTNLNPSLREFHAHVRAFREGTLSMGAYLRVLSAESVVRGNDHYALRTSDYGRNFDVENFLAAYELEKTLNFNKVEAERSAVLAQLLPKLTKDQTNELVNTSVNYRLGNIRHTEFYSYLKDLCNKNGISLLRYKEMNSYLQYVLLSDAIRPEKLFSEVSRLENERFAALIQTPEERQIIDESKQIYLTKKLVDFSLTPDEWNEYKGVRSAQYVVRSNDTTDYELRTTDLTVFEDFYTQAELRNHAITKNLLSAMDQNKSDVAVLVTGGFHSPGIDKLMKEAGVAVITYVPKITKVEDENGTSYLSVFAQEKTPLDQLFAGEKLFLAGDGTSFGGKTTLAIEEGVSKILNEGKTTGESTVKGKLHEMSVKVKDSKIVSIVVHGLLRPAIEEFFFTYIPLTLAQANHLNPIQSLALFGSYRLLFVVWHILQKGIPTNFDQIISRAFIPVLISAFGTIGFANHSVALNMVWHIVLNPFTDKFTEFANSKGLPYVFEKGLINLLPTNKVKEFKKAKHVNPYAGNLYAHGRLHTNLRGMNLSPTGFLTPLDSKDKSRQINEEELIELLMDPREAARVVITENSDITYAGLHIIIELMKMSQRAFAAGLATGGTTEDLRKALGLNNLIKEVFGSIEDATEKAKIWNTLDDYFWFEEQTGSLTGSPGLDYQLSCYRHEQLYMLLRNLYPNKTEEELDKIFVSPRPANNIEKAQEEWKRAMRIFHNEENRLLFQLHGIGLTRHDAFNETILKKIPPPAVIKLDLYNKLEIRQQWLNPVVVEDRLLSEDRAIHILDGTRIYNVGHFVETKFHPFFQQLMADQGIGDVRSLLNYLSGFNIYEINAMYKEDKFHFKDENDFLAKLQYILNNYEKTNAIALTQGTLGIIERTTNPDSVNLFMASGKVKQQPLADVLEAPPSMSATAAAPIQLTPRTIVLATRESAAKLRHMERYFEFVPANKSAAEKINSKRIEEDWGNTAEGKRIGVLLEQRRKKFANQTTAAVPTEDAVLNSPIEIHSHEDHGGISISSQEAINTAAKEMADRFVLDVRKGTKKFPTEADHHQLDASEALREIFADMLADYLNENDDLSETFIKKFLLKLESVHGLIEETPILYAFDLILTSETEFLEKHSIVVRLLLTINPSVINSWEGESDLVDNLMTLLDHSFKAHEIEDQDAENVIRLLGRLNLDNQTEKLDGYLTDIYENSHGTLKQTALELKQAIEKNKANKKQTSEIMKRLLSVYTERLVDPHASFPAPGDVVAINHSEDLQIELAKWISSKLREASHEMRNGANSTTTNQFLILVLKRLAKLESVVKHDQMVKALGHVLKDFAHYQDLKDLTVVLLFKVRKDLAKSKEARGIAMALAETWRANDQDKDNKFRIMYLQLIIRIGLPANIPKVRILLKDILNGQYDRKLIPYAERAALAIGLKNIPPKEGGRVLAISGEPWKEGQVVDPKQAAEQMHREVAQTAAIWITALIFGIPLGFLWAGAEGNEIIYGTLLPAGLMLVYALVFTKFFSHKLYLREFEVDGIKSLVNTRANRGNLLWITAGSLFFNLAAPTTVAYYYFVLVARYVSLAHTHSFIYGRFYLFALTAIAGVALYAAIFSAHWLFNRNPYKATSGDKISGVAKPESFDVSAKKLLTNLWFMGLQGVMSPTELAEHAKSGLEYAESLVKKDSFRIYSRFFDFSIMVMSFMTQVAAAIRHPIWSKRALNNFKRRFNRYPDYLSHPEILDAAISVLNSSKYDSHEEALSYLDEVQTKYLRSPPIMSRLVPALIKFKKVTKNPDLKSLAEQILNRITLQGANAQPMTESFKGTQLPSMSVLMRKENIKGLAKLSPDDFKAVLQIIDEAQNGESVKSLRAIEAEIYNNVRTSRFVHTALVGLALLAAHDPKVKAIAESNFNDPLFAKGIRFMMVKGNVLDGAPSAIYWEDDLPTIVISEDYFRGLEEAEIEINRLGAANPEGMFNEVLLAIAVFGHENSQRPMQELSVSELHRVEKPAMENEGVFFRAANNLFGYVEDPKLGRISKLENDFHLLASRARSNDSDEREKFSAILRKIHQPIRFALHRNQPDRIDSDNPSTIQQFLNMFYVDTMLQLHAQPMANGKKKFGIFDQWYAAKDAIQKNEVIGQLGKRLKADKSKQEQKIEAMDLILSILLDTPTTINDSPFRDEIIGGVHQWTQELIAQNNFEANEENFSFLLSVWRELNLEGWRDVAKADLEAIAAAIPENESAHQVANELNLEIQSVALSLPFKTVFTSPRQNHEEEVLASVADILNSRVGAVEKQTAMDRLNSLSAENYRAHPQLSHALAIALANNWLLFQAGLVSNASHFVHLIKMMGPAAYLDRIEKILINLIAETKNENEIAQIKDALASIRRDNMGAIIPSEPTGQAMTNRKYTNLPPLSVLLNKKNLISKMVFTEEMMRRTLKEISKKKLLNYVDVNYRVLGDEDILGINSKDRAETGSWIAEDVVKSSLVALILIGNGSDVTSNIVRENFKNPEYARGVNIIIVKGELLDGAVSAYYPLRQDKDARPTIAISQDYINGARDARKLLLDTENAKPNEAAFFYETLLALPLWGHENSHRSLRVRKGDSKADKIRAQIEVEWAAMENEGGMFRDANGAFVFHFGEEITPKIEYFFHKLKDLAENASDLNIRRRAQIAYAAIHMGERFAIHRNQPQRILDGFPKSIGEFLRKYYSIVQPYGQPMANSGHTFEPSASQVLNENPNNVTRTQFLKAINFLNELKLEALINSPDYDEIVKGVENVVGFVDIEKAEDAELILGSLMLISKLGAAAKTEKAKKLAQAVLDSMDPEDFPFHLSRYQGVEAKTLANTVLSETIATRAPPEGQAMTENPSTKLPMLSVIERYKKEEVVFFQDDLKKLLNIINSFSKSSDQTWKAINREINKAHLNNYPFVPVRGLVMLASRDAKVKSIVRDNFKSPLFSKGIRFILAKGHVMDGAVFGFYRGQPFLPTIVINADYYEGLQDAARELDRIKVGKSKNEISEESQIFAELLVTIGVFGHENSQRRIFGLNENELLKSLRKVETKTMKNEGIFLGAANDLVGTVEDPEFGRISKIEHNFHLLQEVIYEGDHSDRVRVEKILKKIHLPTRFRIHRNQPDRIASGQPKTIKEFVRLTYTKAQEFAQAMSGESSSDLRPASQIVDEMIQLTQNHANVHQAVNQLLNLVQELKVKSSSRQPALRDIEQILQVLISDPSYIEAPDEQGNRSKISAKAERAFTDIRSLLLTKVSSTVNPPSVINSSRVQWIRISSLALTLLALQISVQAADVTVNGTTVQSLLLGVVIAILMLGAWSLNKKLKISNSKITEQDGEISKLKNQQELTRSYVVKSFYEDLVTAAALSKERRIELQDKFLNLDPETQLQIIKAIQSDITYPVLQDFIYGLDATQTLGNTIYQVDKDSSRAIAFAIAKKLMGFRVVTEKSQRELGGEEVEQSFKRKLIEALRVMGPGPLMNQQMDVMSVIRKFSDDVYVGKDAVEAHKDLVENALDIFPIGSSFLPKPPHIGTAALALLLTAVSLQASTPGMIGAMVSKTNGALIIAAVVITILSLWVRSLKKEVRDAYRWNHTMQDENKEWVGHFNRQFNWTVEGFVAALLKGQEQAETNLAKAFKGFHDDIRNAIADHLHLLLLGKFDSYTGAFNALQALGPSLFRINPTISQKIKDMLLWHLKDSLKENPQNPEKINAIVKTIEALGDNAKDILTRDSAIEMGVKAARAAAEKPTELPHAPIWDGEGLYKRLTMAKRDEQENLRNEFINADRIVRTAVGAFLISDLDTPINEINYWVPNNAIGTLGKSISLLGEEKISKIGDQLANRLNIAMKNEIQHSLLRAAAIIGPIIKNEKLLAAVRVKTESTDREVADKAIEVQKKILAGNQTSSSSGALQMLIGFSILGLFVAATPGNSDVVVNKGLLVIGVFLVIGLAIAAGDFFRIALKTKKENEQLKNEIQLKDGYSNNEFAYAWEGLLAELMKGNSYGKNPAISFTQVRPEIQEKIAESLRLSIKLRFGEPVSKSTLMALQLLGNRIFLVSEEKSQALLRELGVQLEQARNPTLMLDILETVRALGPDVKNERLLNAVRTTQRSQFKNISGLAYDVERMMRAGTPSHPNITARVATSLALLGLVLFNVAATPGSSKGLDTVWTIAIGFVVLVTGVIYHRIVLKNSRREIKLKELEINSLQRELSAAHGYELISRPHVVEHLYEQLAQSSGLSIEEKFKLRQDFLTISLPARWKLISKIKENLNPSLDLGETIQAILVIQTLGMALFTASEQDAHDIAKELAQELSGFHVNDGKSARKTAESDYLRELISALNAMGYRVFSPYVKGVLTRFTSDRFVGAQVTEALNLADRNEILERPTLTRPLTTAAVVLIMSQLASSAQPFGAMTIQSSTQMFLSILIGGIALSFLINAATRSGRNFFDPYINAGFFTFISLGAVKAVTAVGARETLGLVVGVSIFVVGLVSIIMEKIHDKREKSRSRVKLGARLASGIPFVLLFAMGMLKDSTDLLVLSSLSVMVVPALLIPLRLVFSFLNRFFKRNKLGLLLAFPMSVMAQVNNPSTTFKMTIPVQIQEPYTNSIMSALPVPTDQAKALAMSADIAGLVLKGKLDPKLESFEPALKIARSLTPKDTAAKTLARVTISMQFIGMDKEANQIIDEAIKLSDTVSDPLLKMSAQAVIASVQISNDYFDQAEALMKKAQFPPRIESILKEDIVKGKADKAILDPIRAKYGILSLNALSVNNMIGQILAQMKKDAEAGVQVSMAPFNDVDKFIGCIKKPNEQVRGYLDLAGVINAMNYPKVAENLLFKARLVSQFIDLGPERDVLNQRIGQIQTEIARKNMEAEQAKEQPKKNSTDQSLSQAVAAEDSTQVTGAPGQLDDLSTSLAQSVEGKNSPDLEQIKETLQGTLEPLGVTKFGLRHLPEAQHKVLWPMVRQKLDATNYSHEGSNGWMVNQSRNIAGRYETANSGIAGKKPYWICVPSSRDAAYESFLVQLDKLLAGNLRGKRVLLIVQYNDFSDIMARYQNYAHLNVSISAMSRSYYGQLDDLIDQLSRLDAASAADVKDAIVVLSDKDNPKNIPSGYELTTFEKLLENDLSSVPSSVMSKIYEILLAKKST